MVSLSTAQYIVANFYNVYSISRKSWPNLYGKLLYKMGHYYLTYRILLFVFTLFVIHLCRMMLCEDNCEEEATIEAENIFAAPVLLFGETCANDR